MFRKHFTVTLEIEERTPVFQFGRQTHFSKKQNNTKRVLKEYK